MNNTDELIKMLSQLLAGKANYQMEADFKLGPSLRQNGELIYNPGLCGRIIIKDYDLPIVSLNTFDRYLGDLRQAIDPRKLHCGIRVWVNPGSVHYNYRFISNLPHESGKIGGCEYLKNLNSLIRYTDAVNYLSSALLQQQINSDYKAFSNE